MENVDYSISYGNAWKEIGGYYYYKGKVAPDGGKTGVLIEECDELTDKTIGDTTYTLSVEILAQSIQADGKNASGQTPVELAWENANTEITVNADGTLTVTPKS